MDYVTVYDQQGVMLGVLENASDIGYELVHNDLWTATFSLPAGDPKNELCQAHNLVRIPDGTRDLGLYRIVGMPESEESAAGGTRTWQLEHVMATLLDDVLFGYHEIGGEGIYTADVIRYILARQHTVRWQLGTCEFTDQYQYHFENVSLLSALLSLGGTITQEYTWEFDVSTTPWTVNLRRADDEDGCGITYRRNLREIHKTMDASALITRLYPLGYGEGVNQLTIEDANNGVPYIEADTAAVWGVKSSVWTDTRIEDAGLLKARARQVLEGYKNPYISYTASAVDLYRLTGYSWDNLMPGKKVRAMDGEHGISFSARIVSVAKQDAGGDPGEIEITIANAPRDAADSLNTLADRVGIGELYSQGATNLFAIPLNDNADATHPAKLRFYLPSGLVRINKLILSWQLGAFRAYETGASSGGGSSQTSASGGSSTETTEQTETMTYTSEDGGATTVTIPQVVLGSGVTGGALDADSGDEMKHTGGPCDAALTEYTAANFETGSEAAHTHEMGSHTHSIDSHSHSVDRHRHGVGSHTHTVKWDHKHNQNSPYGVVNYSTMNPSSGDASNGYTDYQTGSTGSQSLTTNGASGTSGAGSSHKHSAPLHYHRMKHFHNIAGFTIPAQTINIPAHGHNVKIPGHTHSVSIPGHTHSVNIPAHTHAMTYGIYEGPTAETVTVIVDGNAVPADAAADRELDVTPWLSKNQDTGKITRNAWHEIRLVPDTLTRIEANLFAQVFVQSVGGGNF